MRVNISNNINIRLLLIYLSTLLVALIIRCLMILLSNIYPNLVSGSDSLYIYALTWALILMAISFSPLLFFLKKVNIKIWKWLIIVLIYYMINRLFFSYIFILFWF